MDRISVNEIAFSSISANISYKGTPIHIDSVDDTSGIAKIHPLDQPDNVQEISLTNLLEN